MSNQTRDDPMVGRILAGQYKLLDQLGQGGMGAVYAALDTSLQRKVAIKIVRPDLGKNSEFVARFNREARLAARLRHSNAVTVYGFGIAAVPGLDPGSGERNRIYASLHAGVGDGVDRFTAQRVGGGPDLRGSEYETTARPWLPGAAYSEFFPEHYAIGSLGYRRELAFFAHLDLGGTLAWLDVDRQRAGGRARADETLVAVSARLSTGFVGRTLLQLGYAHNFDVVRDGSRGGDEFTVMVTGRF